ncbi:AsmA family protein [Luminiphilus sp. nBUS_07]|uniref:AsmA family protein n=1 Tax=Luminiphilus sp. nBUS_07 TaxID=3395314 RepID=UPI003EBE8299
MRSISKIFVVTAVLISALVAGALITKESDFFRDFVAQKVSQLLQRNVTFSNLDIDIDIDQSINITVTDVAIAQPAGFTGPAFLDLASAELHASIPDLLLGQPKIKSLSLTQPKLHLIQGLEGHPNWRFDLNNAPATAVAPSKPPKGIPVFLEYADIEDLQLTLIDNQEKVRTLRVDATLEQDSSGAKLAVVGDVNEAPLQAKVTVSSADALTSLTDVNFGLDMNLGDVHLEGKALVRDLRAPNTPQIEIVLQGPSVEYFTELLKLPPFSQGALDLSISVQPGIEQMVVRLDGLVGDFSGVISGTVNDLRTLTDVELAVAVSGPDIGRLADLLGAPNFPHVPFSATGKVKRNQQRLNVSESRINIGRLQIAAGLDIPNLETPIQANLSAQASVPAIERYQDVLQLPEDVKGAVTAQLTLETDKQNTKLSSLITTEYGELKADGWLRGQRKLTGTSLTVAAKGDDLGTLLMLAHQKPSFRDRWSLNTDLLVTNNDIELSEGKLVVEGISSDFTAKFPRKDPAANFTTAHKMTVANPRQTLSHWLHGNTLAIIPNQTTTGSFRADWSEGTLNLQNLAIALAKTEIQGAVTVIPKQQSVAGDLKLQGENLTELLPTTLLPPEIPQGQLDQPLSATSKFTVTPKGVEVKDLKLQIGDLAVNGDAQFSKGTVDVDAMFAVENAYEWVVIENVTALTEPLTMTAKINLSQSESQASIRELTLNTAAGATIFSKGELQFGENFSGSDLEVRLDLPDLQRLGWLANLALPKIPLKLEALLNGDESHLIADTLAVESLDSEFSGQLSISDPSHPNIQLALHSSMIDLRPLYAVETTTTQKASVSPAAPAQPKKNNRGASGSREENAAAKKKKTARNKRVIPLAEINLEFLQHFDADINLTTDRLIGRKRRFGNIELISHVKDGHFIVDRAVVKSESGGHVELSGFGVPGIDEQHFGLTIEGENVRPLLPNSTIEVDDIAALPPAEFSGELFGSGNTVRELAQNLNGSLQIALNAGVIPGELSGFFTNDFLAELVSLLDVVEEEEVTELRCGAAFAEVHNGKVKGDPLAIVISDKLAIVSKGQVNLHTEKLFLAFNTVPQKGLGISATTAFNPFVGVAGTLARPQMSLDPEGTIVQGGLAVMTGGISLIGKGFFDRMSVGKKSCAKAAAKAEKPRQASRQAFEKFRKAALP